MSAEQVRRLREDLATAVAERDRLRADLAVERQNAKVLQGYFDEAVDKAEAAEAERDRLRAVVGAAVEAVAAQRAWIAKAQAGGVTSVDEETDRRAAAFATLGMHVDQLDVSPTMGWRCRCGVHYDAELAECPACGVRHTGGHLEMTEGQQRTIADAVEYANSGVDPTSPTYDPDQYGTRSTEGAPHESDGDGRFSSHGAPDPPSGGPVPPSTPAPQLGASKAATIGGWGVWHADDEEWIGFGVTNGLAAELIPEGYDHLVLRPVVVRIEES